MDIVLPVLLVQGWVRVVDQDEGEDILESFVTPVSPSVFAAFGYLTHESFYLGRVRARRHFLNYFRQEARTLLSEPGVTVSRHRALPPIVRPLRYWERGAMHYCISRPHRCEDDTA